MSGTISKLNYSHYIGFPNDGRRHEIIDGEHYVNPASSTYHQTVSRPEYWIVDPFEHALTQLIRTATGSYESSVHDQQVVAKIVPNASIDLKQVW